MVSGGAPLNPEVAKLFTSLGLPMIQGYGMTELSPVVAVNLPESPHPGSVGKPLSNTRVGLRDPDEKGYGEVVVSGPTVLERYLNSDEPPEEPFPTGDIGRIEDGHLFIEGRKKFTIVTAEGKNIFPEQVEEEYGQSPFIEEILVVGQERADGSGVQLKAIVYPNDDRLAEHFGNEEPAAEEVTERIREEIRRIGRENLEPHQRVRDFELRWEPFPRTPTQKIKRHLFDRDVHTIGNGEG